MTPIDLRSDTRTVPDERMRAAMARAVVGDDSFGDDPTVRALEERVAGLLGTEAGLFTCGGTMSNVLAVLAGAGTDDGLVVTGAQSHLVHYENDGARVLARARVVRVPDPYGELDADAVDHVLAGARRGRPALVCLENTANRCAGNALDEAAMGRQAEPARRYGARVHLDGARLANAAVALNRPLPALAGFADTVSFSLCKGLGAPAGSVLCGTREVIDRARGLRRMLGGTMHQSGVLAAAGLVALDRIGELAADHDRARRLRDGLRRIEGVEVRRVPRPTNMAVFRFAATPAGQALALLEAAGVLALPLTSSEVRLVVHREHDDAAIDEAVARIAAAAPPPPDPVARPGPAARRPARGRAVRPYSGGGWVRGARGPRPPARPAGPVLRPGAETRPGSSR